ncbi:MAG: hypothetical protein C0621_09910 [Desulfuromonas sp.]|nr:MAG: hypothetical protein C0621_09910 [Desulfuromonas sp.]
MLYVIPTFTQVYADANVELPWATKILIALATWFGKGAPILLPSLLFAVMWLFWWGRGERGGRWFDRLKLHLPLFSGLVIDYALLGFCRTLGTTLSSGIPVVQALQMSRGALNNRILEERLSQAIKRVQEGGAVSTAFEETSFFPRLALRMIGVGESTGSLPDMLGDVADYYESEVERRLDRMTTLVEPLMMLVMGLVIGGIVVAIYIPIFQLAGTSVR